MKPLALSHVNLPARDPDALAEWYVARLGFRRKGPYLWSAGTLLVFVRGEAVPPIVHFGFRVDDEEEVVKWNERLRAAGVDVGQVMTDEYTRFFGRDPEGNRFEIFWEPAPG